MALKAFLDDSGGGREHSVLVVAGAIASPTVWAEIEDGWRVALRAADVPVLEGDLEPYFRMTDCLAGYGPFAGWDAERRTGLFASLANVLGERVANHRIKLVGGSCGLPPPGKRRNYTQQRVMNAYERCIRNLFQACSIRGKLEPDGSFTISQPPGTHQSVVEMLPFEGKHALQVVPRTDTGFVLKVTDTTGGPALNLTPEGMEFVFAEHPQFDPLTHKAFKEHRKYKDPTYLSITFALQKTIPALQVADLIAHQFHQHCENPDRSTPLWKAFMEVTPWSAFVESHYEDDKTPHDSLGAVAKIKSLGHKFGLDS